LTGTPGLIIAAPGSGSGKTTVTLGLLRHLHRSGVRVAPFKVGPDYIDPAFHTAACGQPSVNLDAWAMRPGTFTSLASSVATDAELVVGEGVMGLFDGAADGSGSTADVSRRTGWPIVLVVDAAAQGASAAAVVHGFSSFQPDVDIAGVVFNRIGSEGHRRILVEAMAPLEIPVLGCIPRTPDLALPERHLGLVQASEQGGLSAVLDATADLVATNLDIETLRGVARPCDIGATVSVDVIAPLGSRIALARDDAFRFSYPHVLDSWRRAGAEIIPFSPLAGEGPDGAADAIYLPGGYPELHAGRLAANSAFLGGLRSAAARDVAIFGECGGYMVLGEGLIDADGARHAMAGLLPLETSFAERRLHLGYRAVRVLADGPLGNAGSGFRGHEFHYATVLHEGTAEPLFEAEDATGTRLGTIGRRLGRTAGSFIHLIDREGS
jgi:cobyrinic acid a,c-diamide synthase